MIMIFAIILTFAMFVCSAFSSATAAQQSELPEDDETGKSIFIFSTDLYRIIGGYTRSSDVEKLFSDWKIIRETFSIKYKCMYCRTN